MLFNTVHGLKFELLGMNRVMGKSCTSFHSCSYGDTTAYNGPIESPKERLYDFYKKMKGVKVENKRMKNTIQKLEKKNKEMEKMCVNIDNEMDEYVNELVEWKKKCASLEKQSMVRKWSFGLVIVAMLLLWFSVMYY
ncbi:hypothetical protein LguiB_005348 [Lonicera macranthoides]